MKLFKSICLVTMIFISFAHAQNINIETLHFLNGNWEVDNYKLVDNQWKSIGTTRSEIKLEHDGKFISEKVKYLSKYGEINMITSFGYDNRLKK